MTVHESTLVEFLAVLPLAGDPEELDERFTE